MGAGGDANADRVTMRHRLARVTHTPLFGLAVITPLVFAGAVGATPQRPAINPPARGTAVAPLAAVATSVVPEHRSTGPSVVAVARPPAAVHIAAGSLSAPPPSAVVYSPGALQIPPLALSAYRNAEQRMSIAAPDCGVSWNLLAGIGRIESLHANNGATDPRGNALQPIYGPVLDGSLPGNEVIVQSMAAEQVVYARAMGPMQFLPGTWSRYAVDGDGDGVADPQNLYDSTLAAARYLCSGGLNLRDQAQVLTAILRYNNSMPYARNVLGWAAAYATGVAPVDLPPVTGPAPPVVDAHLDIPAIGPGLDHHGGAGLPTTDPLTTVPLIDFSQPAPESQPNWPSWLSNLPWLQQQQTPKRPTLPTRSQTCTVICIESHTGPPAYAVPPSAGAPPAGMPPYAAPPPPAPQPMTGPPPPIWPPGAVPPPVPAAPPAAPPPPMPAYAVPPPAN